MATKTESRRCRWGIHDWSIYTEPIHVRWCYRCGKRDPEERTVMETLLAIQHGFQLDEEKS